MAVSAGVAAKVAVHKAHERGEALGGLLKSTEDLRVFAEQQSKAAKQLEKKEQTSKFRFKRKKDHSKKEHWPTKNSGHNVQSTHDNVENQQQSRFKRKTTKPKQQEYIPNDGASQHHNVQSSHHGAHDQQNRSPDHNVSETHSSASVLHHNGSDNHIPPPENKRDALHRSNKSLGSYNSTGTAGYVHTSDTYQPKTHSPSPPRQAHSHAPRPAHSHELLTPDPELFDVVSVVTSHDDLDVDVDSAVSRAERLKAQSMELFPKFESKTSDASDEAMETDNTGCWCWCKRKKKKVPTATLR